jgi:hypothetical protein
LLGNGICFYFIGIVSTADKIDILANFVCFKLAGISGEAPQLGFNISIVRSYEIGMIVATELQSTFLDDE